MSLDQLKMKVQALKDEIFALQQKVDERDSELKTTKLQREEELRRRRNDESVELRKAKKDESLQKRRNIVLDDTETSPLKEAPQQSGAHAAEPEQVDFDLICTNMASQDPEIKQQAVQQCRKVLSRARNPPIAELCDRGAVRLLIKCLSSSSNQLLFEAAWALTNIASGDSKFTWAVVEGGAVPHLLKLMLHPDAGIAEQSLWALGNIAGDGAELRDRLVEKDLLTPLLRLLERSWRLPTVVANVAWTMSNLCRHKNPSPPRSFLQRLLPTLCQLLQYQQCTEAVGDAAWAFSYISDSSGETIQDIIKCGALPTLVELLRSPQPTIVAPSLRALGGLVTGTDEETQAVIDAGLLPGLHALLTHQRSNIVKEACWVASNVTAGSQSQIQAVVDQGLIPAIINVIKTGDFKAQKEACWVVSNLIGGGTPEQCAYLLNNEVLPALSVLLGGSDVKLVSLLLESIKKLFEVANYYGQLDTCCLVMEECGGLDKLETLQDHENDMIYHHAFEIIDQYFGTNDENQEPSQTKDQPAPSDGKSGDHGQKSVPASADVVTKPQQQQMIPTNPSVTPQFNF